MSNVPITHAALLTYPGNLCLYPHSPIPKADSSGGSQTSIRKGVKPDCHSLGPAAGIAETGEPGWPAQVDPWANAAGRMGAPTKNTRAQQQFAGVSAGFAARETHSHLGIRGQLHQLVLGKTTNTNRPLCSHSYSAASTSQLPLLNGSALTFSGVRHRGGTDSAQDLFTSYSLVLTMQHSHHQIFLSSPTPVCIRKRHSTSLLFIDSLFL